ncbi:MFS transporter [Phenylobacterium terrae]|uniref:MFS transporter n=1 Tax=Phenylobacterium terrae TaxID=2665495 RepID=A0ABW4MW47_9CAUL
MTATTTGARPRIFYGWAVVAGAFAVTFFGFGSAYTFSTFFEPLQREFAASRAGVSLVFSIAGFLYFALGVVSGPLADRFGPRALAVGGMALVGAGLALAGAARSLTEVYLAYGLGVGLGVGFAYVPAVAAVQKWFVRRRGLASGLAVSGIGLGTLAMPPLAAWLIEAWGWRAAYVSLGVLALVAGGGLALLLSADPARHGLAPDGEAAVAAERAAPTGAPFRSAIRSRTFAGLYLSSLICAFGVFLPFAHLVPYALDRGVPAGQAVLLLGAVGVGSTAGRFLLGGLSDRLGQRPSLLLIIFGVAATMALWPALSGVWPLAAFAVAYGVFYGGWVAILPALLMSEFGGRHVSSLIGVLYTSVAFGTLVGPTLSGWAFDVTGGYQAAILAAAACNAVGGIIAWRATRR